MKENRKRTIMLFGPKNDLNLSSSDSQVEQCWNTTNFCGLMSGPQAIFHIDYMLVHVCASRLGQSKQFIISNILLLIKYGWWRSREVDVSPLLTGSCWMLLDCSKVLLFKFWWGAGAVPLVSRVLSLASRGSTERRHSAACPQSRLAMACASMYVHWCWLYCLVFVQYCFITAVIQWATRCSW